ncbi:unnamed protein product [Thelazia callipaeda]|uniref:Metallophos domain-containing protein n=1 Tax=Thelazia callipaeda TaxID=103827 RepID=A0A0N5CR20_THECL|nr:unnamed protein product [Thelazia callipaeda]
MVFRFSATITFLIYCALSAKILQITDIHLDVDYSVRGDSKEMCHEKSMKITANLGRFGDYMCDSPDVCNFRIIFDLNEKNLLEHLMANASKIIANPDLLLLSGDFVPHIEEYDFNYVRNALEIITNYTMKYYPNTTIIPLLGNHDAVPPNALPDHDGTIYEIAYSLWKQWIGEENAMCRYLICVQETFLKGGYYKYEWNDKAIIAVLNTNLYYRFNPAIKNFKNKTDPAGQFAFLNHILMSAEKAKKKVHIVAHIAPGVFEKSPYISWMEPEYNQHLIDITIKFANTIGWMLFGHHHSDTFHIVTDFEGKPVQIYLMAPSVTPWFSSLPGAGSINPSFRVYIMDDGTQQLIDAV